MTQDEAAGLTANERAMVADAAAWVRDGAWSSAVLEPVTRAVGAALDRAMALPPVARASRRAVRALADGLDEELELPPPHAARVGGAPLAPAERLDLLDAGDAATEEVRRRHVGRTAVRGTVTGAMSSTWIGALAGLAADVTATTQDQARAVAEVLAAYGVQQDLRPTALSVLALAGERDPARRRAGLLAAAGVTSPSGPPSPHELEDVLAEQAGVRLATDVVERVVRLRVRQRAAGVVPLLGAAAGAVTSATMTGRACDVAQHVGRLHVLRVHAAADPDLVALGSG